MHVPKPTSAGPPSGEPTPVHLTVAYNGTRYRGWQIQPLTKTVQGELQGRLQRILRCPDLRLAGTSRTDAGVHALDQHALTHDVIGLMGAGMIEIFAFNIYFCAPEHLGKIAGKGQGCGSAGV